jgi:crossover junction endodeoxyribonuclease RuvC
MSMRRILGIDPGSRITGFAVIDSDGRRSQHVDSGCIRLDTGVPVPQRLGDLYQEVAAIVERHRPVELAIEQVFLAKNADSALKLGQARGAAICAALSVGVEVHEYSPKSVKQAVVGSGGADKVQVQHMIKVILSMNEDPAEDQADALAVAVCHAHSAGRTLGKASSWRRWKP